MEQGLNQRLNQIVRDMMLKAQADVCLACANFDSGVENGCFLRLQPRVDTGLNLDDDRVALMLVTAIEKVQPLDPVVVRQVVCEGYNNATGYPDDHSKSGGWLCYNCGRHLPSSVADSRVMDLPVEYRQCPCGASEWEGYYAV